MDVGGVVDEEGFVEFGDFFCDVDDVVGFESGEDFVGEFVDVVVIFVECECVVEILVFF